MTDGQLGRVMRVDRHSGAVSTFAAGLPLLNTPPGIGGPIDVAFVGRTAYVLVANVGPTSGSPTWSRDLPHPPGRERTPVADIGAWAVAHPPATAFVLKGGVQYAMEPYHGGFAVTDGHHNRVIRVRRNGEVSELQAFGNVVPTGLAAAGRTLFVGLAGPVPHRPEDGKVSRSRRTRLRWRSRPARRSSSTSSSAPIAASTRSRRASGPAPRPGNAGAPASPNTGSLTRVNRHGGLTPVAGPLDRPTSVAFSHRNAYVVTLTGKVMKISGIH